MSGVEAIAAILGIAGAGISVAATLYEYSSSASSAKDDVRMIAESIDTYASVLETLGRQLEASQAVCSAEGLRLAADLERQSQVLFQKISEHIPSKTQSVSIGQKLSWFFNKDRVKFLLSQIEQLKATVSLLLQILILAQTTKPSTAASNVNINVNVVNAEIGSQFRRAENRVLQYHNASIKLAKLQIDDEQPAIRALPWQEEFRELDELPVGNTSGDDVDEEIVSPVNDLTARQRQMSLDETHANSAQLVNMLLDHWTTIEPQMETAEPTEEGSKDKSASTEASAAASVKETPSRPMESTAPDTTSEQTSSCNPIKGWWKKYRQSQKNKEEEERSRKQLEEQEKEISRREAQLQREQTLLERETKLQEAQKQTDEARLKALADKQQHLADSQRIREETARHAQVEREMRAQAASLQKESRKDLAAQLKAARTNSSKAARKYSSRPPRAVTSLLQALPQAAPAGAPAAGSYNPPGQAIPRGDEAAPPPYSPSAAAESTASSPPHSTRSGTTSPLSGTLSGIDQLSSRGTTFGKDILRDAKQARKQRREDRREARRALKKYTKAVV